MNDIDVTVYFNEHRLAALDEVLNDQGRTIEGVLRNVLRKPMRLSSRKKSVRKSKH